MVFVVLWATMKLLSTTILASVNFPLVDLGIDAWLCLNISSVMVIYVHTYVDGKDFPLPGPEGPLSSEIASYAIRAANKEIQKLLPVERRMTRSPYLRATPDQKAIVAKYASENGIVSAIRRYQKDLMAH